MIAINRLLAAAALAAALIVMAAHAHAAGRVAFVVGNSAYQHVSILPNPSSDADAIAAALSRLDFAVTLRKDLSKAEFERELADFSEQALGADMALVYYAGHGMELNGQNYLIPTDASLKADLRVKFETVSLDNVLAAVESARGLKIVLLDACRDNPFMRTMTRQLATRSIGRGLARVEAAPGVLVSYAAAAGTVAEDGAGDHSPYTDALLRHIEEPGLELNLLFRKVADEVQERTNGRQTPYEYGRLSGENIYLKPPVEIDEPDVIAFDPCRDAGAHYEAISELGGEELFEEHIRRFPTCAFAGVAEQKLKQIRATGTEPEQVKVDEGTSGEAPEKILPATETETVLGSTGAGVEADGVNAAPGDEVAVLPDDVANEAGSPITEEVPVPDSGELALAQQKELDRLGCEPGRPDGKWGPRSRRAMAAFNRETQTTFATGQPSIAAVDDLKKRTGRVCPLKCSATEMNSGNGCVPRNCRSGQRLNSRGVCYIPKPIAGVTKSGPKSTGENVVKTIGNKPKTVGHSNPNTFNHDSRGMR
jgi:hypothetical protein